MEALDFSFERRTELNSAEIAEVLEEPEDDIRRIYEVVRENAPEYDVKKIMQELKG